MSENEPTGSKSLTNETNATFKETLRAALKQNGHNINPDSALEITEMVLSTAVYYLERAKPHQKHTISILREAFDSIDLGEEE